MGSVSEWMARLAPAAIVLKAIVVSLVGISALMIFILLRRWVRARYFARRERQTFDIRQRWNELVNGKVLPETWRFDPLACEVLETMLLDSIEVMLPCSLCAGIRMLIGGVNGDNSSVSRRRLLSRRRCRRLAGVP